MWETIPTDDEINAMTPREYRVYENSLRRAAQRQRLKLRKSRRRDPRAYDYGTYQLIHPYTNGIVVGDQNTGFGMSIDEIHAAPLERAMGYVNNVTDTLFADVSYYQPPVDDSYTNAGYRVLSIRANDGTFRDPNFAANHDWCVRAVDDGRLVFFIVYCYWRPNWDETGDTLIDMVTAAGGPQRRMVVMIDVESGGNPGGDQSDGINRLYWKFADWIGDRRRVIGYGDVGDLNRMWPVKPDGIRLIIAAYGSNPDYPGKVAHQYTDGQGYGGGLPEGAPPFGNCDMNSADGLSVEAFARACGLDVPGAVLPPPDTLVSARRGRGSRRPRDGGGRPAR